MIEENRIIGRNGFRGTLAYRLSNIEPLKHKQAASHRDNLFQKTLNLK